MKISIVTLSMMKKHQGKFYNAQDIGLGRALADMGHETHVFNFIPLETDKAKNSEDTDKLGEMLYFHRIPSRSAGVHSMYRKDFIPEGTQGVICFSDNQMNFRYILGICKRRSILCIPYVGVHKSNNAGRIKGMLMDMLSDNMKYYRKLTVLAKTPAVHDSLRSHGVRQTVLAPVCLDENMLNKNYRSADIGDIRRELGKRHGKDFSKGLVLYVGRLTNEKQPVEMIGIFADIKKIKPECQLIMIGSGELEAAVKEKIQTLGLKDSVTMQPRVENSRMWEYYMAADALVNLNEHEIFGMSILEAMYYERKVTAVSAPGPDFIIADEKMGVLCSSIDEIAASVYNTDCGFDKEAAHKRIAENFLWKSTANIIIQQFRN